MTVAAELSATPRQGFVVRNWAATLCFGAFGVILIGQGISLPFVAPASLAFNLVAMSVVVLAGLGCLSAARCRIKVTASSISVQNLVSMHRFEWTELDAVRCEPRFFMEDGLSFELATGGVVRSLVPFRSKASCIKAGERVVAAAREADREVELRTGYSP